MVVITGTWQWLNTLYLQTQRQWLDKQVSTSVAVWSTLSGTSSRLLRVDHYSPEQLDNNHATNNCTVYKRTVMIGFFFQSVFTSFLHLTLVRWTENVKLEKIVEVEKKKKEVPSRANNEIKVQQTRQKRRSFAAYMFHVAKGLQKHHLKGKAKNQDG